MFKDIVVKLEYKVVGCYSVQPTKKKKKKKINSNYWLSACRFCVLVAISLVLLVSSDIIVLVYVFVCTDVACNKTFKS